MKTTLVMSSFYQQGKACFVPANPFGAIWLLFESIGCKMMQTQLT
jgi:hypothetical protein